MNEITSRYIDEMQHLNRTRRQLLTACEKDNADQRERRRDIAEKLMRELLCRVDWETCTMHKGLLAPLDGDVLEAARKLKSLGESWEEWT